MGGRNRRRRRKRKGSFSFLYKLLVFFVICGAIVAALAVFFKVDTIEVTGNSRYTAQEIADSGGIHVGDNLFLVNKFSAAEAITRSLPYISSVRISRKLPDTLCIQVEENATLCAIEQSGGDWILSGSGKLVEQAAAGEEVTRIVGLTPVDPQVGMPLQVPDEQESAKESLLQLSGRWSRETPSAAASRSAWPTLQSLPCALTDGLTCSCPRMMISDISWTAFWPWWIPSWSKMKRGPST